MLTRDQLRKMEQRTIDDISIVAGMIAEEPSKEDVPELERYLGIMVQQLIMLRRFISQLPHSVN